MADADNKKLAIANLQNLAKEMSELSDKTNAMQLLITARGWGDVSDADVEDKGLTGAKVLAFVGLMTQFNNLMSNKAVTTTQGRTVADAVKAL